MIITAQFCIMPFQQSTYRYKFVELVNLLIHITGAKKLCEKIYHIIHYIVCMFMVLKNSTFGAFPAKQASNPYPLLIKIGCSMVHVFIDNIFVSLAG